MQALPRAIMQCFGLDCIEAFRAACLHIIEANIRAATDEQLTLLNKWLGRVFAIAEHERRRRMVPALPSQAGSGPVQLLLWTN